MFGIVYPAFQSLGMKYIGVEHATQRSVNDSHKKGDIDGAIKKEYRR